MHSLDDTIRVKWPVVSFQIFMNNNHIHNFCFRSVQRCFRRLLYLGRYNCINFFRVNKTSIIYVCIHFWTYNTQIIYSPLHEGLYMYSSPHEVLYMYSTYTSQETVHVQSPSRWTVHVQSPSRGTVHL